MAVAHRPSYLGHRLPYPAGGAQAAQIREGAGRRRGLTMQATSGVSSENLAGKGRAADPDPDIGLGRRG